MTNTFTARYLNSGITYKAGAYKTVVGGLPLLKK